MIATMTDALGTLVRCHEVKETASLQGSRWIISETSLGHAVLRAVGRHYRDNPKSWCVGPGSLLVQITSASAAKAKLDLMDTGCIHTMITQFGLATGGRVGINEAINILCKHHGLAVKPASIYNFNDGEECGAVTNAIKFVEAPLAALSPDDENYVDSPTITAEDTAPMNETVADFLIAGAIVRSSRSQKGDSWVTPSEPRHIEGQSTGKQVSLEHKRVMPI